MGTREAINFDNLKIPMEEVGQYLDRLEERFAKFWISENVVFGGGSWMVSVSISMEANTELVIYTDLNV